MIYLRRYGVPSLARFSFVKGERIIVKLTADERGEKNGRHRDRGGGEEGISQGKLAEKLFNIESWVSHRGRTKGDYCDRHLHGYSSGPSCRLA